MDKEKFEKKRAEGGRATRAEWKQALEYYGVGTMFATKPVRDIEEVEAVNGRIMMLVLDTVPKLHVVNAYAPQAGRATPEKDEFYEQLQRVIQ